ncbi:MAG: phage terminase large subunit family protein [bacterium]
MEGHEWQREILTCDFPRICIKKASQIGATAIFILKLIYNLIYGTYLQGGMVIMPTVDSVIAYSKGRFTPLIEDERIKRFVSQTDAATIKRIKKSFLYFVGGQLTSSIEKCLKKSSTALKSTPVDGILLDEVDEISPKAIDLAKERLSHSKVKHEFYLSTPTIPGYGIDKVYQGSDQRVWMIHCEACGHDTCLELEFPNCLLELPTGQVIRACLHCRKEIYPKNGRWVPQAPQNTEMRGYWISQLCSPFVEPKAILKAFKDGENIQEFYNSKLGMAYIASENKLTVNDVFQCQGQEPMLTQHPGPTCAGIDVGKQFHITIGARIKEKVLRVLYAGRFSSIDDISDLCHRFNVRCAVIDIEPETRVVREWQQSQRFQIYLCDYVSSVSGASWDDETRIVRINRTEALDSVHSALTTPGRLILPRRSSEMEEFARELTNSAKVIEENELGERRYVWRKLGADHYLHSLGYCLLASQSVGIVKVVDTQDPHMKAFRELLEELEQKRLDEESFNPWRGLNIHW